MFHWIYLKSVKLNFLLWCIFSLSFGLEADHLHYPPQFFHLTRFLDDCIHSTIDSLLNVPFFSKLGHSSNDWLQNVVGIQNMPDFISCLISIHHGHFTIHQYQAVAASYSIVGNDIVLHFLDGFETARCSLNWCLHVDVQYVFQNDVQTVDIEGFVVDDEDLVGSLGYNVYVYWS